MELDSTFLLACLIMFVASVISGLAGFGLSIVSIPPLLLLYDPGTAIAINKILTLGTTWIIVVEAWKHISWRWIVRLMPTAIAGLLLGGWLLRVLDPNVIRVFAGAIVLALALLLLGWQPAAIRERGWLAPGIGLVSGAFSTTIGMPGPPLILTFTLLRMAKETFRATTATWFVTSDLIGLPALVLQGAVTTADLRLSLALAPIAIVGRLLGIRLVRHVSPLAFRRATLVLMLLTGTVAIATGLAALR